jgi:hypothetical protein
LLIGRFAPVSGFVTSRQTFVRRRHVPFVLGRLGQAGGNKIADGMNAAGRSAKRLFDDAQLLADAARFSVMPFSS